MLTRDLMDAIPSARNMQAIGALVPGIRLNLPDVGGAQQTEQTYMATHGNSALHNTILLDGMPAHTNLADGAVQNYIDNALIDESVYQTSAISAESFSGRRSAQSHTRRTAETRFAGPASSAARTTTGTSRPTTSTPSCVVAASAAVPASTHLNDFNGAGGGPIMKDKLWYFASLRRQGTFIQVPNTFKNDGTPGIEDAWINSYVVRGTWQATPRNKFAVTYQRNFKYKPHEIFLGGQEGVPIFPEQTAGYRAPWLYYIGQAKWTSPVTSRVLIEAGMSADILHYFDIYQPGTSYPRGTAEWYANASHLDSVAGGLQSARKWGSSSSGILPTRSRPPRRSRHVTGTHNIKTGILYGVGQ